MFMRFVGRVCVLSLFTGGCAGSETEPTRTTTTARVSIVDPAAGTTMTVGTPFKISFTVEYAQEAFTLYTVAFVRDDGLYSPPLTCGGGGSSGGAFAGQPVDVSGVVGADWKGNILYQFAKGHRVNAMLLLKRLPEQPNGPASDCVPIGAGGRDPSKPTEGTVFPEQADQRVDMPLNWLIQP
jgi:hypothetical protein